MPASAYALGRCAMSEVGQTEKDQHHPIHGRSTYNSGNVYAQAGTAGRCHLRASRGRLPCDREGVRRRSVPTRGPTSLYLRLSASCSPAPVRNLDTMPHHWRFIKRSRISRSVAKSIQVHAMAKAPSARALSASAVMQCAANSG